MTRRSNFLTKFFRGERSILQFLHKHRAPALASELGAFILYGAIAVAFASSPVAFFAALRLIPWVSFNLASWRIVK